MFGNPETTPGGRSTKHYASLRISIRKTSQKIMRENEQIGINSKVKVEKNRFSMPFREAIIPIYYEEYNPTPLDKFVQLSRKVNSIRTRKGNFYFSNFTTESPEDMVLVLFENKELKDLLADIREKAAKKALEITDPDVLGLMEAIENDEFTLEAFNQ